MRNSNFRLKTILIAGPDLFFGFSHVAKVQLHGHGSVQLKLIFQLARLLVSQKV